MQNASLYLVDTNPSQMLAKSGDHINSSDLYILELSKPCYSSFIRMLFRLFYNDIPVDQSCVTKFLNQLIFC